MFLNLSRGQLMKQILNYFAYGSNLHPLRLQARIGACKVQSVAQLEGARLCFHKVGLDDSGKCDIVQSAQPGSTVWGVVYQITAEQKILLDHCESLGRGYQILHTEVRSADDQRLPVFTYQAMAEYIDPQLQPFDWYHEFVFHGVCYHGFPVEYREMIHAVNMIKDPDSERATHQQILLRELRKSFESKQAD